MSFQNLADGILNASTSAFGEEVTFYPKCGGAYVVQGIFDNDYQVIDTQTEHIVSSNQPALGVNLNDLKFKSANGDKIKIRGRIYEVYEKKEDGQGGATLLLHATKVIDANADTKVR